MARKFSHPGVLRTLIKMLRMSGAEQDSFGALLERTAARWPERVGVRFEDKSWTWREFNEWCNRYAHTLKSYGIGKGDVVAVNITNRPGFLVALMGTVKLGGVAALLNTGLKGESLAQNISAVRPKALIVGEEQLDVLEGLGSPTSLASLLFFVPDTGSTPTPHGFLDLEAASVSVSTTNLPETATLTFADPAVYIYTSGTTGLPKAAIYPHQRLVWGGGGMGAVLQELRPFETVYGPLPLYHTAGLMGGFAASVYTGATFVLARRFSASTFWDEIRHYGANTFTYVGEILRYLYNQPPSPRDREHNVRTITGSGLRSEMWLEFKSRFGIKEVQEVYGASETPTGFVNLFNFDQTCGWAPRGVATIAYDLDADQPRRAPDGRAIKVPPGQFGLLVMKIAPYQQFYGYTDEEATQQKILHDVFKPGDRWFNSGDLVLNQGHGHVRFVDRLGDTFRWHSENVATTQVEGVIDEWPQIAESVVWGVAVPDSEGRCGMAKVLLREGESLDEKGFAAHLRGQLPEFAVPRFLRISKQVELTGTFKYKKQDLRDTGFDLSKIDDPVLVLTPADDAFHPLTPQLQSEIEAGAVRL